MTDVGQTTSARLLCELMGKYDIWRPLFEGTSSGEEFVLSMDDLEAKLGQPLPRTAREFGGWWSPSQAAAVWTDYGYRARPDLASAIVRFEPDPSGPRPKRTSSQGGHDRAVDMSTPEWKRILEWNKAIADECFGSDVAGHPAYLDMEDYVMERIASAVGLEAGDATLALARDVRKTIHSDTAGKSTFSLQVAASRQWARAGRLGPPPCLSLLAVFSLAAELMQADEGLAANNYVGRLCQLLEVDLKSGGGKDKLYRDFTRQSHDLWTALNTWISEGEGSRGIPTARAFDRRVHVGVPISQALLKEGDRLNLHQLFYKYRLSPGQSLSPVDMRRLLADWLPTSSLSPYAKTLWGQGADQQRRIAEIASIELAAWDGSLPDEVDRGRRHATLRLAGGLSHFPSDRLDLGLIADKAARAGVFRPTGDEQNLKVALGGPNLGVRVIAGPSTQWREVEPEGDLSLPDLISLKASLVGIDGTILAREPRGLVVMVYDDSCGFYVEQERVHLGRDTILLVHGHLADDVSRVLAEVAREGYRQFEPGTVSGVPETWFLFSDVQIVDVADTENADLAALMPIAWSEVSFGLGLQLAGSSTWHRDRPPEVRLSSLDSERVRAVVESTQRLDLGGTIRQDLGEIAGSGVVDLGLTAVDLIDGEYTVSLVRTTKTGRLADTVASGSFRLRSGDFPRPTPGGAFVSAGRMLSGGRPCSAISAFDGDWELSGAFTKLNPKSSQNVIGEPPPPLPNLSTEWVPEDDRGPALTAKRRLARGVTCAMGSGAHYWLLPTFNQTESQPKDIEGHCKNCAMLKWFPQKPRSRRNGKRAGSVAALVSDDQKRERGRATVRPIIRPGRADYDVMLDALTYARSGSWAAFSRLAKQVDSNPWFPIESARLLESLGHIEVLRGDSHVRPDSWTIAPTTVVFLPAQDHAILVGGRGSAFLSKTREVLIDLGGSMEVSRSQTGPVRVVLRGFKCQDTADVAELLEFETDVEVRGVVGPAEILATRLRPLSEVADCLLTFDAPQAAIQWFHHDSNQWVRTERVDRIGAYRFLTRPVIYGVARSGSQRDLLMADNRWAKWIAALFAGARVLGYNARERVLEARLGAGLPGLYERAAVLSSGKPPREMSDGKIHYHDIPPKLAGLLTEVLST